MDNFKYKVLALKTQTLWRVAKSLIDYFISDKLNIAVRCSVVHVGGTKKSLYEKILHDNDVISTYDLNKSIAKININQLKLDSFDDLYVVLFFVDEVLVLKYNKCELLKLSNLYRFQHRDNSNESQFFISELNLKREIESHLIQAVSYEDLKDIIVSMN